MKEDFQNNLCRKLSRDGNKRTQKAHHCCCVLSRVYNNNIVTEGEGTEQVKGREQKKVRANYFHYRRIYCREG